ncbi:MAG: SDR family NAD(P)-dependent oxidoreductase [Ignavibacteria bacterium]|jgi:3-oxoacyl-[acyl-carrier protein] reductase|nr:SDR family NAD(P)-dependent oxidoreductase [Ignavibacteria bacterium]MCU7503946.1 SDR family NAD(P)-dependent oxidoreductase [Ignavibacteria bacterium]MCU7515833.1 SDR family NAD(P)-dependent oxidoreductase [Ignavibacteria bacterium]
MDEERQVSIVTGAGRGIGKAIALRLAKEGHNVAIFSRTEGQLRQVQEMVALTGVGCVYYAGDVADEKFVNSSVENVLARFGKVDCLINNAGIGIFKKLVDSSLADFRRQIDTNLVGAYLFSKAVLPSMIKRKSGSIINVASLAGKNSMPGGTMYSSTKHALLGLARSLMLEVREYNIRVASVCPGSVESEFARGSESDPRSASGILMPEDVAETVMSILKMPVRALISEIDLRPSNPKK